MPVPVSDPLQSTVIRNAGIEPFKYPAWVTAIGGVALIATMCSLLYLPGFVSAARELHFADQMMDCYNYGAAAKHYRGVLKSYPSSKTARIGYATAAFGLKDRSVIVDAMERLRGERLSSSDMARLSTAMPESVRDSAFTRVSH